MQFQRFNRDRVELEAGSRSRELRFATLSLHDSPPLAPPTHVLAEVDSGVT